MAPHTSYVTCVCRSTALMSSPSRYVHVTPRAQCVATAPPVVGVDTPRSRRQDACLDVLTPVIHDALLTHIKYRHVIPNTTIFNIDNFITIRWWFSYRICLFKVLGCNKHMCTHIIYRLCPDHTSLSCNNSSSSHIQCSESNIPKSYDWIRKDK